MSQKKKSVFSLRTADSEYDADQLRLASFLSAYMSAFTSVKMLNDALDFGSASEGANTMTKKKATRAPRPDVKFLNVRLSTEEKGAFKKWLEDSSPDWAAEAGQWLESGHKISFSYDFRNKCFIASITCWQDGDTNFGFCFSTRGPDPAAALLLMVYKLVVVLENGDWEAEQSNDDWG